MPTWQKVLHRASLIGLVLCGLMAVYTVAYVVILLAQLGD
jgi:hypothetical protein